MMGWINNHGIETVLTFYIFSCIVGSMPPLPDNASYSMKWAFLTLHAMAGNLRSVSRLLSLPEMPTDPNKKKEE